MNLMRIPAINQWMPSSYQALLDFIYAILTARLLGVRKHGHQTLH